MICHRNPPEVFMRALVAILVLSLGSLQISVAQMQTPSVEVPQAEPQDQTPQTPAPQAQASQTQAPQPQAMPAPPQTARQALLEMFIAPKPGALEKHLPEITRKTLMSGGDPMKSDVLREFVNFSAGFTANQKSLSTFDEGPILFAMEPAGQQEKLEVLVERDDLMGEVDEIELSPRVYKEGALQSLPVVPRFTFSMKQEKEIWKLNEIAVTLRIPLADEDYLNGLKKRQDQAMEPMAVGSIRTINTAEITYAASYPDRGFTCNLAELGGAGGEPTPEHAMLIDDTLASGEKGGYKFSISGCDAHPAARYQVTAVPSDSDSGLRAFCSDESAVVKYDADGKAATCLTAGVPLQ